MRIAVCQLTSGDDPHANCEMIREQVRISASGGADLFCTPEVSNCVSQSRSHQQQVLSSELEDPVLRMAVSEAKDLGIWISLGSIAVKTSDPDGRFANRSILIAPSGEIAERYDKMHMFDVTVSEEESYRESAGYRPGRRASLARIGDTGVGLSICYDLRFAYLYRALAQAGADVLLVPSAFSPVTGASHWEPLLRARAIETGCFVIAAAQTGTHPAVAGKSRRTYGHSMVVSPWGEVILDAGTDPGVHMVDLNLDEVAEARRRIPALQHDRDFFGPDD